MTVGMMVRVTTFPAVARIPVTSLSWKGGEWSVILGGRGQHVRGWGSALLLLEMLRTPDCRAGLPVRGGSQADTQQRPYSSKNEGSHLRTSSVNEPLLTGLTLQASCDGLTQNRASGVLLPFSSSQDLPEAARAHVFYPMFLALVTCRFCP